MARRYRPHPFLDQAYYTAIGHAIVTWAIIEIQVDQLIARMLRQKKATKYRRQMSLKRAQLIPGKFKDRLKLFNDLANLFYNKTLCDQLQIVTKECLNLYGERNRLAHGDWILFNQFDGKGPRLLSRTHKHGVEKDQRPFTVAQIRALTHKIGEIASELSYFSLRCPPEGPIWPRLKGLIRHLAGNRQRAVHSAGGEAPSRRHRPSEGDPSKRSPD